MRTLVLASIIGLAAPLCSAQNAGPDISLAPIHLTASGPVDLGSAPTKIPVKPVAFDVNAIDKSANPCDNFFQYACGNWNKNNPIPSDRAAWGRFAELAEYNNYLLYKDLVAAADAPKSPLQKKYGDYFAACMNTDLLDKLGDKPLQPDLHAIDELTSVKQLAAFNAKQDRRGGGAFFAVAVTQDQKDSTQQVAATGQGGLTLPDRDYYLNPSERFQKLREDYVDNMVKTFELLGDSPDKAPAGSRRRHDHRDRTGQGLARPRRSSRSRHALPPHVRRRPPGQDAELRLADLPRRRRPAEREDHHRHQPSLSSTPRTPRSPTRICPPSRATCAGTPYTLPLRCSARTSRT